MNQRELKAYAAKRIVDSLIEDPELSRDLKRILSDLMNADLKTLEHRRAEIPGAIEILGTFAADYPCDLLSVVDASGARRLLLFL